jgi:hypothetical protein
MNSARDPSSGSVSSGSSTACRFDPGQVVATPAALALLEKHGINPLLLLGRHLSGDWGELSADDRLSNDAALVDGGQIFSSYLIVPSGCGGVDADDAVQVWIITDAKDDEGRRRSTCLMTPRGY